jgi:5-methylcytosine-specific restriction endonuclease McrA
MNAGARGRGAPPADALARIVEQARREREERERGYREQALRLLPHVCARCGRDFAGPRLRELTVHHKDHDHHHNPADGSNWELLCLYCHDDEHMRELEQRARGGAGAGRADAPASATHRPFEALAGLLKERK